MPKLFFLNLNLWIFAWFNMLTHSFQTFMSYNSSPLKNSVMFQLHGVTVVGALRLFYSLAYLLHTFFFHQFEIILFSLFISWAATG